LIADVEVDVLGVLTLADLRPHFIRAALHRRQHVIAEKPIAASIPEEATLLREIEASDRLVAVNLFNRNAWWGGLQGDGRVHLWTVGANATDSMRFGCHRNTRHCADAAQTKCWTYRVTAERLWLERWRKWREFVCTKKLCVEHNKTL
jgi:hypothetical protein